MVNTPPQQKDTATPLRPPNAKDLSKDWQRLRKWTREKYRIKKLADSINKQKVDAKRAKKIATCPKQINQTHLTIVQTDDSHVYMIQDIQTDQDRNTQVQSKADNTRDTQSPIQADNKETIWIQPDTDPTPIQTPSTKADKRKALLAPHTATRKKTQNKKPNQPITITISQPEATTSTPRPHSHQHATQPSTSKQATTGLTPTNQATQKTRQILAFKTPLQPPMTRGLMYNNYMEFNKANKPALCTECKTKTEITLLCKNSHTLCEDCTNIGQICTQCNEETYPNLYLQRQHRYLFKKHDIYTCPHPQCDSTHNRKGLMKHIKHCPFTIISRSYTCGNIWAVSLPRPQFNSYLRPKEITIPPFIIYLPKQKMYLLLYAIKHKNEWQIHIHYYAELTTTHTPTCTVEILTADNQPTGVTYTTRPTEYTTGPFEQGHWSTYLSLGRTTVQQLSEEAEDGRTLFKCKIFVKFAPPIE